VFAADLGESNASLMLFHDRDDPFLRETAPPKIDLLRGGA
jgi:hypothetical protein